MARTRVNKIAFQGEPGANSHLAARDAYPNMNATPCATFEDALAQVKTGKAKLAMIPIENSVAGRVADIHHLLPHSGLYIVGEHFERVRHQLARAAPCKDGGTEDSAQPHYGARAMPQGHCRDEADAGHRSGHGRCRTACRPGGRSDAERRSPQSLPRKFTGCALPRRTSRTRLTTPRALWCSRQSRSKPKHRTGRW